MYKTSLIALTIIFITQSLPSAHAEEYPFASVSTNGFYIDHDSSAAPYDHWLSDVCSSYFPGTKNLIKKITNHAHGIWFGSGTGHGDTDPEGDAAALMRAAGSSIPIVVVYNIPGRDMGGNSAGGTPGIAAYENWVSGLAHGIGNHKALIVLEPDALLQLSALRDSDRNDRLEMLAYAVRQFKTFAPAASVYIDAGHTNATSNARNGAPTTLSGASPREMARWLEQADVADAAGFALNTSSFLSTENNSAYGSAISAQIQKDSGAIKHFVIDTSRNGNDGYKIGDHHCNVPNQTLGAPPHGLRFGLVDAFIWAKVPGESDGNGDDCNGGAPAGTFMPGYACGLASRAVIDDGVHDSSDPQSRMARIYDGALDSLKTARSDIESWLGYSPTQADPGN